MRKLPISLGYRRLTADEAQRGGAAECRGWFGHLVKAKRNPLMPDLFVFHMERLPLFVELKVKSQYRPGQREMIQMGLWVEARSLDRFIELLKGWEKGGLYVSGS